jgi:hypothetical protein
MNQNNRIQQRSSLKKRNPQAKFHVEVYNRQYVLDEVHDVSVSGAGIKIPSEIAPGTPVKLVYRDLDYSISVLGKAVWCAPVNNQTIVRSIDNEAFYRTGIQFDARDRNCTLFFMALREFIDTFDAVDHLE